MATTRNRSSWWDPGDGDSSPKRKRNSRTPNWVMKLYLWLRLKKKWLVTIIFPRGIRTRFDILRGFAKILFCLAWVVFLISLIYHGFLFYSAHMQTLAALLFYYIINNIILPVFFALFFIFQKLRDRFSTAVLIGFPIIAFCIYRFMSLVIYLNKIDEKRHELFYFWHKELLLEEFRRSTKEKLHNQIFDTEEARQEFLFGREKILREEEEIMLRIIAKLMKEKKNISKLWNLGVLMVISIFFAILFFFLMKRKKFL